MPRKPDSAQSVPAALDAIMLDESWQGNLTNGQRVDLVAWAQRMLSGSFESSLLTVRLKLAAINRLPTDEQRSGAIRLLLSALE